MAIFANTTNFHQSKSNFHVAKLPQRIYEISHDGRNCTQSNSMAKRVRLSWMASKRPFLPTCVSLGQKTSKVKKNHGIFLPPLLRAKIQLTKPENHSKFRAHTHKKFGNGPNWERATFQLVFDMRKIGNLLSGLLCCFFFQLSRLQYQRHSLTCLRQTS